MFSSVVPKSLTCCTNFNIDTHACVVSSAGGKEATDMAKEFNKFLSMVLEKYEILDNKKLIV